MTNREKIKQVFPNGVLTSGGNDSYYWGDDILVSKNWWNAEYKEPKQKMFDYLTAVGQGMIEGEKIADDEWIEAINAIKNDFKEKAKRQKEKAERESGGKVIEILFGTKQILRTITKHTKGLMK